MNASFTFPAQQVVTPRPQRPQKQADGAPAQAPRNSNSLRASVLDAALELGIGSNSLVADWMFNNAVREEDECEEPLSPEYPPSFPDPESSKTHITSFTNNSSRLAPGTAADITIDADVRSTASSTGRGVPVAFPDGAPLPPNNPLVSIMPAPSVHSTATGSTKKLKKLRKGDGYESDSAYLSESGRKSKEKEKKKKAKEDKLDAKVGNDAGLMVDPNQRSRKRSFVDAVRGKKAKDIDAGYATDASSSKTQISKKDKSKAKLSKQKDASDVHYDTDGGTKRSKTRSFFKLSSRSSKPDLTKDRATTPPVPLLKEQMPLPIAQRFAKKLASPSDESTYSLDETRSTMSQGTSIPTTSLDGFRSTTSLGVSLASAVSSRSTVNDIPPSNVGQLPSLSFQPLTVDIAQPPSPHSAPPHLSSPPVSFPSSAQSSGTIRDSQASSGSSSSGVSNPGNRTNGSEALTITSNISSSLTSPSTSHSHFQISSPRIGHGMGAGSTSATASMPQQGHGQTPRLDTFGRPPAGSRLTSPPSSGAAAAGIMSFQIARDITTVPLVMRKLQQPQQGHEPLAQIQDDGRTQPQIPQVVEVEQVEAYPKRMSVALPNTTAPLNISKGGGLRIRPSLEKINLLGLRKDSRDQLSAGGATPSTMSSLSPLTAGASPLRLPPSPNSQTSAGQYVIPRSPIHPPPLQSARSWNGTPMSPPQASSSTLSPHTFVSAPTSTVSSPVLTNPMIPPRSAPRARLSLNPPPNGNQLVAPTALAYYDIPPPSPPPMGPLPLPPPLPADGPRTSSPIPPWNRSRSPIPPLLTNHNHPLDGPSAQFPSPAQLRQRMLDRTPRKLPSDETHGPVGPLINPNIRRGKESPFPPTPVFQRTAVPDVVSSSGGSDESADSGEGMMYDVEQLTRSSIQPVSLNSQEMRVLDSVLSRKQEKRSSWVNFEDVPLSTHNDTSEEDGGESRNDDHDVGDSLDGHRSLSDASVHGRLTDGGANRSEESAYSGKVLTRRRSSEDLKPAHPDVAQARFAWDDSQTVGDRTSRWSGSIYSRMSIMDEEESNAARDRFVQRVEAMLADGKPRIGADETGGNVVVGSGGGVARQNSRRRDKFVPPVPKIPVAFAGSTRRSEAVPAGRMWNKF